MNRPYEGSLLEGMLTIFTYVIPSLRINIYEYHNLKDPRVLDFYLLFEMLKNIEFQR